MGDLNDLTPQTHIANSVNLPTQSYVTPTVDSTSTSHFDSISENDIDMISTGTPGFGSILKRFRKIRGWSQTNLAQKLSCEPVTVTCWEREVHKPGGMLRDQLLALMRPPGKGKLEQAGIVTTDMLLRQLDTVRQIHKTDLDQAYAVMQANFLNVLMCWTLKCTNNILPGVETAAVTRWWEEWRRIQKDYQQAHMTSTRNVTPAARRLAASQATRDSADNSGLHTPGVMSTPEEPTSCDALPHKVNESGTLDQLPPPYPGGPLPGGSTEPTTTARDDLKNRSINLTTEESSAAPRGNFENESINLTGEGSKCEKCGEELSEFEAMAPHVCEAQQGEVEGESEEVETRYGPDGSPIVDEAVEAAKERHRQLEVAYGKRDRKTGQFLPEPGRSLKVGSKTGMALPLKDGQEELKARMTRRFKHWKWRKNQGKEQ